MDPLSLLPEPRTGATIVRLADKTHMTRRLIHGVPDEVRVIHSGTEALFLPGSLVGYLVERPRARALFIFRTSFGPNAVSTIAGVSPAVDLILLASTARAVRKATTVLRFLSAKHGRGVDGLSDGFWLRLADFLVRRPSCRILTRVAELLRTERPPIG